jgi:hypothetical protein
MKPRLCNVSNMDGITRYEFIYPDVNGYENWRWTNFDLNIIDYLHISSHVVFACHLNQPVQSNGLSFINNLKSIFENIVEIDISKEVDFPVDNWWYKTINKLFSIEDENTLYCGDITNANVKECFLMQSDIGCFWNVFFLEKHGENELFRLLHEGGVKNDAFIFNQKIKFVLYRDYVKNSISITVNDSNRKIIDKYIDKSRIFMQEKYISNIFNSSYLDELPAKNKSIE